MSVQMKNDPQSALGDPDALRAKELARALAVQGAAHGKVQLQIEKKSVEVPERAIPLITQILEKLGAGDCVEVRTVRDTLSTTEAAEILNVSRPYVVKLLDRGEIPCVATVGNHRRIKRADLLDFQRRQDAKRHQMADELATEGQRLNREYGLER